MDSVKQYQWLIFPLLLFKLQWSENVGFSSPKDFYKNKETGLIILSSSNSILFTNSQHVQKDVFFLTFVEQTL